jgi:hypothetical protein
MLVSRGFGGRWVSWVLKLVKMGLYVLESMMKIAHSLNQAKGLGKVTPAPLLFNLVIDVFTRILMKASSKGYLTGLLSSMCPEGILSLQYADDTLLFL